MMEFVKNTLITVTIFVGMLAAMSLLLYLPLTFGSWIRHSNDVAELTQVDAVISIYEEEYGRAATEIAGYTEGSAEFRLNADSPVASLVQARVKISNKLVAEKAYKHDILSSIISRCVGPFRFTVAMFDNVTCETYRTK